MLLTGCRYEHRDPCQGAACATNQPPVTVLTDVEANALTIGRAGVLTLDASQSHDPEDDIPLTFDWSTDCTGTAEADPLGLYRMQGITVDCAVTLVVTDSRGASAEAATIAVTVSPIDSYVAINTARKCASDFSLTEGGTYDFPWCTLDLGLQAAAAVRFDAVKLEAGELEMSPRVLSQRVVIRGGYVRDDEADWQRTDVTDVAITGVATHGFMVVTDASLRLEHLGVYFTEDCEADCTLLASVGGSIAGEHLRIGLPAGIRARPPVSAPGQNYAAVSVLAAADGSTSVDLVDVETVGINDAKRSVGVGVVGPATVTLTECVLQDANVNQGIGVYIQGATSLTMTGGGIASVAAGGSAIAVLDGAQNAIAETSDGGCADARPCNASQSITLTGVAMSISGRARAFGVAAFGTNTLVVRDATLSIGGQLAVGALTLGVGTATLSSTIVANAERIVPVGSAAAVALSDGYLDAQSLSDVPGSGTMNLEGGTLTATTNADSVSALVGAAFYRTRDVVMGSPTVAVSAGGIIDPVDTAIGVWTQRVSSMTAPALTVAISGMVDELACGMGDGDADYEAAPSGAQGSEGFDIAPNITVTVFGTPGTLVAGIGLGGTKDVRVHDGSVTVTADGTGFAGGLVSLLADGVVYDGLDIGVLRRRVLGEPLRPYIAVGVHDGHPTLNGDWTSKGLSVLRNAITASAEFGISGGVAIQGRQTDQAVIANNSIETGRDSASVGVFLKHAGAAIAFNTMRIGCGPSAQCTGVYLLQNEDVDVDINANVFSAWPLSDPAVYATFIVEYHQPTGGNARYTDTLEANLFACEVERAFSGPIKFVASSGGNATTITDPSGYNPVPLPLGTNRRDAVAFCATSGPHITDTSNARRAVTASTDTHGADIDGDPRAVQPFDAGADTFNTECPPP